nr:very short patch repair endonuclease [Neorhizobium galegae]
MNAAERSQRMSRIRSKDTKPEVILRHSLHARGLRCHLDGTGLTGRPNIVFSRRKVALFVHGCFWHGHGGAVANIPKTNSEFWLAKFERNKARDKRVIDEIDKLGWRPMVVRECEIITKQALELRSKTLDQVIRTAPVWYGESAMILGCRNVRWIVQRADKRSPDLKPDRGPLSELHTVSTPAAQRSSESDTQHP